MEKYLNRAKANKKDEFYTRYEDIEKELQHYDFNDRVVYCKCDNPNESNFVKYFVDNFEKLGIKRVIATHYVSDESGESVMLDYDGTYNYKTLNEDGDFRSDECIELLKRSDAVVTNPPFSLFREFVGLIIENKKDFVIIGNQNAITYKDFFPHLKSGYVSLGVTRNKTIHFSVPDDYYESKSSYTKDGIKYVPVPAITWFTTMCYNAKIKPLKLTKEYNPTDYPIYDNYNAINVDKAGDIPKDYFGNMGVPITYFNKHDKDRFVILGKSDDFAGEVVVDGKIKKNPGRFYVNGVRKYDRLIIKRK